MKTRTGFVSNSSSSSFVLLLSELTPTQIEQIENHIEEGDRLAKLALNGDLETSLTEDDLMWMCGMQGEGWDISVDYKEGTVKGHTWMDNFSMHNFFKLIGVPESAKTSKTWLDNEYW